jgi:hypothetical protein
MKTVIMTYRLSAEAAAFAKANSAKLATVVREFAENHIQNLMLDAKLVLTVREINRTLSSSKASAKE